jgi:CDP-4-dehydro-6-deoxyglucose reductase, E3
LGKFVYRPGAAAPGADAARGAPPMLLIGGGTGIAPLLSILRHLIENGINRDIQLYWGVRSEQDLYAHATLEALSRRAASLRYVPVLSEASPQWRGLTGWVHEAAFKDIQDLDAYEVYAAGPPAMIAAVRREFDVRGASANRLYFDSFDYAPDTLERQRMRAVTKS